MAERTRASIIADLRQRKRKQIEEKRKELELLKQELRMLDDLATMEGNRLFFEDREQIVSWTSGTMAFRRSGKAQYQALKAVYEARETGITHADLAAEVYGDDLADIRNVTYALASKMEKNRCPFELKHDRTNYWLESSVEHY